MSSVSKSPLARYDIATQLGHTFGIFDRLRQEQFNLPFEIEFRIVPVSQGRQEIYFTKPFINRPVVVANYAEQRSSYIPRSSPTRSFGRLGYITLPRLTGFTDFLDKSSITPWGDQFYNWAIAGARQYGIPQWFVDPFVLLIKYIGNLFFSFYYSATGDFEVIGRAYSSKILKHIEDRLNAYIDQNINALIADIESKVNNMIATLQDRLNRLPHEFLQEVLGYVPDSSGRYSLPIPVTIFSIDTSKFVVDVPHSGSIIYIAIGKR